MKKKKKSSTQGFSFLMESFEPSHIYKNARVNLLRFVQKLLLHHAPRTFAAKTPRKESFSVDIPHLRSTISWDNCSSDDENLPQFHPLALALQNGRGIVHANRPLRGGL